jgi:predicted esterase
MKGHLLLALSVIFFIKSAECQTYSQLRDSAAKIRENKDYVAAFNLLSRGIKIAPGHPYHNDIYDAAALASQIENYDTAYYYLNHLLNEGEYDMITCDANSDPDFKNLRHQEKWGKFIGQIYKMKNDEELRKVSAIASCVSYQDQLKFYSDSVLIHLSGGKYTDQLLLRLLNSYQQFPFIKRKKSELLVFATKINDSTRSFYEVQLPADYNASVSYPLLLVLHGAVYQNAGFPDPRSTEKWGFYDTTGMNQFFSQLGYQHHVIVVYPHANREFNWMFPDDGFHMISDIVKDMKRYFNIDDNRVFLSGHSNGATGVISYLLKSPSLFAGFYGFNSNPKIRTGGTFIKNALNRSYFNVATDKDYYFPVSGHDTLERIAKSYGIDWQNHVYRGFPHWFPQFKESYSAFRLMFEDMDTRTRNPFRHDLFWECDDVKYGLCDWIGIDQLDTGATKKDWQTSINFPVTHWIDNRDTSKISDTVIIAFSFPRLSGAVKAHYKNNIFEIETSRVKKLSIFISPEMIDISKPVTIYVNGEKLFSRKISYNREFMIQSFREDFDRRAVWVNYINLTL